MIKGIGIDMVELDRIKKLSERQERLVDRILTPAEKKSYAKLSGQRRIEFLAGRFAAKEAYAKANGTGIGEELSFLDIEIGNDEKGKPMFIKPNQDRTHLSISHSKEYAVAQVVIENI